MPENTPMTAVSTFMLLLPLLPLMTGDLTKDGDKTYQGGWGVLGPL